jgi:alpha,alpha-trehalase
MKKNFLLPIVFLLFIACQPKISYQPKYEKIWTEINDSINHNWHNHVGKMNALPDTFAFAMGPYVQFYWDTYFTQKGLLVQNKIKWALGGANNLLYLVDSLGFVPNANASWGENRSQPPYLSIMVWEIYQKTQNKPWLSKAYSTLVKEYHFWTDTSKNAIEKNQTSIPGLQRYFHHASRRDLTELFNPELVNRFGFSKDMDTAEQLRIASNFAAEAETGMDFTTRFENRCPDFVAVDLNCNLYCAEQILAKIEIELGMSNGSYWLTKAEDRKKLINKYCWAEDKGWYYDYDFVNKRHSKIAAATGLSPLFAGIASPEQAKKAADHLSVVETEFGIATCEISEQKFNYQWDHYSIWPPMQSLAIMALDNYGFKKDAERIAMKYLDLVAANYLKPDPSSFKINQNGDSVTITRPKGMIYEKYTRDGKINDREYKANIMFSWSAGTFAFAFDYLQHNL